MATFTKRIGWLAVTAAMLLIVPIAQADDDGSGDNSGGVSAPDNTAYYQAYQQWLQFQQKIYEDRRHDWEVGQEQLKKDRLDRQLYHPPLTEIWAAEPLNALLFRLQDLGNRGARFAEVGIPKNVLAHMNLTTGISPGNVAMLKDNGVLDWPMALRQPEFKPLETQLGSLTSRLIAEVKAGEVNADEYHTAVTLVDLGKEQLMSNI